MMLALKKWDASYSLIERKDIKKDNRRQNKVSGKWLVYV